MSGCSERRLTLLKVGQPVDSFRVLFFVLQHWAAALRAMAKRWCIARSVDLPGLIYRHRVSCPNSGLSSFRFAGQRAERVLY
jgi:hypothetical protein